MRVFPGFQRNRQRKCLFAASGLLLLLTTQTVAQSGRRAPKPAPSPIYTPQTDTETTPTNNARELKQKVSLLVGIEPSSKHLLSEDAIFENFVEQLRQFKNVTTTPIGAIKRDRAVKRAKSETESAVVILQFDVDEFQSGTVILNSPDLDVKVLVFEPKTGQKKFEGKVYYKAVGGPMLKKDNWPNGTPIKMTSEAAGIEAAELLYYSLAITTAVKKTP